MSINRVLITGNLTRDPEMRATASGMQVLHFGVAVNDRRRNPQSGEWEDYPNFIDCVVFGARADALSRFLTKGTKVAIEGKLRYSSWETKDGQKRSKIEVVVDDVEFLSARSQQGQNMMRQAQQAPQMQGQPMGQPQYQQAQPMQQAQPQYQPVQQPTYSNAGSYQPVQQAQAPVQTPPSDDVYAEDIPF